MASIDEMGGGGNKRHRDDAAAGFTEADDSGSSPSKRCAAAAADALPGSGGADLARADLESSSSADDDDDDGSDGAVYEYADSEEEEAAASAAEGSQDADDAGEAAEAERERRYVVLTEEALRARQEADTARVAEVLSVPLGAAALLLRHFRWRVGRVQEEWFADGERVRAAVGLPEPDEEQEEEEEEGVRARVCGICFDEHPAGATRAAACGAHFYCGACWRGYLSAAARDGARCLSLRCPEPSCGAAVARELVDAVLLEAGGDGDEDGGADRERFARFWLRSYVEESGGRVRWCAGPGCPLALEWVGGDAAAAATDVFCACRHGFCWRCGEEAHRPVSCATVRAWLDKGRSEAETANWVVAHTKPCPKCRRPIEKNQGCNHMRCSPPCGHHFCWLCLQPAGGENHYSCQDPVRAAVVPRGAGAGARARAAAAAAGAGAADDHRSTPTPEEAREQETRRHARAALDRYLHHYERWAANRASLDAALRDTSALLERGGLERMARAADRPVTDLSFLAEAYAQVADGRRVLRWAHAYGYYLDPARDAAKRALFDDLEGQANRWLECLHAAAEVERMELFGAAGGVGLVAFGAYRAKVANLTRVTRRFLGNLVRAFETDLPEVVAPPAPARKEEPVPPPPRMPVSVRLYLAGGHRNLRPAARPARQD